MVESSFSRVDHTPPTAFYFAVNFLGHENMESSFQGVSGLNLPRLDESEDGRENAFVHQLR